MGDSHRPQKQTAPLLFTGLSISGVIIKFTVKVIDVPRTKKCKLGSKGYAASDQKIASKRADPSSAALC
eukprot:1156698-Pelagomonas_calceolata.AAC.7